MKPLVLLFVSYIPQMRITNPTELEVRTLTEGVERTSVSFCKPKFTFHSFIFLFFITSSLPGFEIFKSCASIFCKGISVILCPKLQSIHINYHNHLNNILPIVFNIHDLHFFLPLLSLFIDIIALQSAKFVCIILRCFIHKQ
jgi:hypothetical protein